MKESYKKILYIFILLQPFIDLVTALMTRFDLGVVSLGVIIKGIFVLVMLGYLFLFNKSKYKKKSLIYIGILGIFYLLYLITKPDLFDSFSHVFNELIYIFKFSYYPLCFITTVNFMDQFKFDRKKIINLLVVDLIVYSLLIIVPTITNTGFNSYNNNEGYGIVGWFYSANEISAILTIIYPFFFLYLDKDFNIKNCLGIILVIAAIIIIGTKTPFYAMLIIDFVLLIYYLFNAKKKTKQFIFMIILIGATMIFKAYIPANVNYEKRVECYDDYTKGTIINNKETGQLECQVADGQKIVMLSGREVLLNQSFEIYRNSSTVDKFFGIGFSNRESIGNGWIGKLAEMDFFDILFRFGIIGFIIYMIPIFVVILKLAFNFLKTITKTTLEKIIYVYATAIGIGVGFLVGHVFGSPAVSFYLAPISAFALSIFDKNKKIN